MQGIHEKGIEMMKYEKGKDKFYITYSTRAHENCFLYVSSGVIKVSTHFNDKYFTNQDDAQFVIANFEKELKILFEVNNA